MEIRRAALPVVLGLALVVPAPPAGAHGGTIVVNRAPGAVLGGAGTGLTGVVDVAVDTAGRRFVLQAGTVTVFAASARGDAAPLRSFPVATSEGATPTALAVDDDGYTTVVSALDDGSVVQVLGPGSAPSTVVTRSSADLGIAGRVLDVAAVGDDVALLDGAAGAVGTYALRSGGTEPTRVLATGPATAVDADPAGRLLVGGSGRVELFAAGADGDTSPLRRLSGSAAQLTAATRVTGLHLGDDGELLVAASDEGAAPRVLRFDDHATGNVRPDAVLRGARTTLPGRVGLAVDDDGSLLTWSLAEPGSTVAVHRSIGPYAAPAKPSALRVRGQDDDRTRAVTWKGAVTDPDVPVEDYRVVVTCAGRTRLARTVGASTRRVVVSVGALRRARCDVAVTASSDAGTGRPARTAFVVRR